VRESEQTTRQFSEPVTRRRSWTIWDTRPRKRRIGSVYGALRLIAGRWWGQPTFEVACSRRVAVRAHLRCERQGDLVCSTASRKRTRLRSIWSSKHLRSSSCSPRIDARLSFVATLSAAFVRPLSWVGFENLAWATSAIRGWTSIPRKRYPSCRAAVPVAPTPANGSMTRADFGRSRALYTVPNVSAEKPAGYLSHRSNGNFGSGPLAFPLVTAVTL
jgi:hypothetical protein